ARIIVGNPRLDQRFLEIRGPAFGPRTLPVVTAYRVFQALSHFRIEAMPRYRRVDVIVQRVAKLDFLPEMAVLVRARAPENIGLELVRHVIRNRKQAELFDQLPDV